MTARGMPHADLTPAERHDGVSDGDGQGPRYEKVNVRGSSSTGPHDASGGTPAPHDLSGRALQWIGRFPSMTVGEAKFAEVIYSAAPSPMRHDDIMRAMYGGDLAEQPDVKILKVHACRVRQKAGVEIQGIYKVGYRWAVPDPFADGRQ